MKEKILTISLTVAIAVLLSLGLTLGLKGDFKGVDGQNGKDADETQIIEQVLSQIPTPKDGKDGVSVKGKDGEIKYIYLPATKGDKGDPGTSIVGPKGERGIDGITTIIEKPLEGYWQRFCIDRNRFVLWNGCQNYILLYTKN